MNPNQKRNIIYSILLVAAVFLVYLYRTNTQQNNAPVQLEINGQTMGTFYQIKYLDAERRDFKSSIDSLLVVINQSLSTYIPDSELSRFNQKTVFVYESPFFYPVLVQSQAVWEKTDGLFDPTIGPLVNAYGFGPESRKVPSQERINELMESVGFDKIFFDRESVCKLQEGIYLDFSANAKGYGVDLVAEFLESKGLSDYMVNIGGDLRVKGLNREGNAWSLGIEKPVLGGNSGEIIAIIRLKDESMATSGNYRNFFVEDDVMYYHTIDPRTGFPAKGNILSSSVIAPTCIDADAYATAFMVGGFEKSMEILERVPELKVFFVYSDEEGQIRYFFSPGLDVELVDQAQ